MLWVCALFVLLPQVSHSVFEADCYAVRTVLCENYNPSSNPCSDRISRYSMGAVHLLDLQTSVYNFQPGIDVEVKVVAYSSDCQNDEPPPCVINSLKEENNFDCEVISNRAAQNEISFSCESTNVPRDGIGFVLFFDLVADDCNPADVVVVISLPMTSGESKLRFDLHVCTYMYLHVYLTFIPCAFALLFRGGRGGR